MIQFDAFVNDLVFNGLRIFAANEPDTVRLRLRYTVVLIPLLIEIADGRLRQTIPGRIPPSTPSPRLPCSGPKRAVMPRAWLPALPCSGATASTLSPVRLILVSVPLSSPIYK